MSYLQSISTIFEIAEDAHPGEVLRVLQVDAIFVVSQRFGVSLGSMQK